MAIFTTKIGNIEIQIYHSQINIILEKRKAKLRDKHVNFQMVTTTNIKVKIKCTDRSGT